MPIIYFLILIILILASILIMVVLDARKHQTKTTDELVGICTSALDLTTKKNTNLQKIISLLETKGDLDNSSLRAELKVSSRTIVRYMDELEQKGLVRQVGKTGHTTSYRLK